MKAVRFDSYGEANVLTIRDVEDPTAAPGRAVVEVKAAGINPGEIMIFQGHLHDRWPATFPSGEGSDLAGIVREVGDGVSAFSVGDPVLGWTEERASHAELVSVPADHLTSKPETLSWEVAGGLFVAGMAAVASIEAVNPAPGETVVVSAAAGGVGSIAVQLGLRRGARMIGLAGGANHDWLRGLGVIPVAYGDGQGDRIRAAAQGRVDAFVDCFGGGYVDLAVEIGVAPKRINTITDMAAAARVGASTQGTHSIASAERLGALAALAADGALVIPVTPYPLARVRDAYAELAQRHLRGKIVLVP